MNHPHDSVQVKVTLSHPLIPTHTSEQVFLRVDVRAPVTPPFVDTPMTDPSPAPAPRPSLDLALIVDRSGSMYGDKLGYAKSAVLELIDRLQVTDHLSLCAYDDRVEVVFPRNAIDALVMKANVAPLEARGSTNLSAGLLVGCVDERGSGRRPHIDAQEHLLGRVRRDQRMAQGDLDLYGVMGVVHRGYPPSSTRFLAWQPSKTSISGGSDRSDGGGMA